MRKRLSSLKLGLIALALAAPLKAEKPWQVSLSMAPTKGFLSVGRDLGNRYVGLGLHSLVYSARDGLEIAPALGYQHRFSNRYLPYFGVSADMTWLEDRGWRDPRLMEALGYEFRFRYVYAHAEVAIAKYLDSRFMKKTGYGWGVGLGVPF